MGRLSNPEYGIGRDQTCVLAYPDCSAYILFSMPRLFSSSGCQRFNQGWKLVGKIKCILQEDEPDDTKSSLMSKIRILAVEDDPIHQERLRMVVHALKYELIDVLHDPHEVVNMIVATRPDILLMDIDLSSDINGIELVGQINKSYDLPTVFLTSFRDSETFNQAKETHPIAYITKPYEVGDLQRAIELAVFNNRQDLSSLPQSAPAIVQNHIFVKDVNSLKKVRLSDIRFVEAYDKYCYIHTPDKKYMLKERLKNIATRLPRQRFIQIHRSFIINLEAIDDIQLHRNIVIIDHKEVGIGRSYRQAFLSSINTLG